MHDRRWHRGIVQVKARVSQRYWGPLLHWYMPCLVLTGLAQPLSIRVSLPKALDVVRLRLRVCPRPFIWVWLRNIEINYFDCLQVQITSCTSSPTEPRTLSATTWSSTVPSTDSGWLLMILGPALVPTPRSSTHGWAPSAPSSIHGPSHALMRLQYQSCRRLQVQTTIRSPPSPTEPRMLSATTRSSTILSTKSDWLLTVLNSALALALRPSTHGRAPAALS